MIIIISKYSSTTTLFKFDLFDLYMRNLLILILWITQLIIIHCIFPKLSKLA